MIDDVTAHHICDIISMTTGLHAISWFLVLLAPSGTGLRPGACLSTANPSTPVVAVSFVSDCRFFFAILRVQGLFRLVCDLESNVTNPYPLLHLIVSSLSHLHPSSP